MANLNIHPAPGMGDLTAGFYVVPQNPIQMANEGISRVPSLGEFLSASFVVPQNPFWSYSSGQVQPLGQGAAGMPMSKKGMGCGCGGGCGGCGGHGGMGDISTDLSTFTTDLTNGNFTQALSDTILGIPAWGYAAGLVAAYFLLGPSTGPSRVTRARRAYKTYAS